MADPILNPVLVVANRSLDFWHPGIITSVLLTGVQSNGRLGVVKQKFHRAGDKVNPRKHAQDLTTYVLKGQMTFTANGKEMTAKSGSCVSIPKHTPFTSVIDQEGTETVTFSVPAGLEQILIATSTCPAKSLDPPPSDLGWSRKEQIQIACEQYGLKHLESLPKIPENDLNTRPTPFMANADSVPSFWVKPVIFELWTILCPGSQTSGSYTLSEITLTKGNAAAPMKYGKHDESHFVLEGQGTLLLDSQIQEIKQGDFIFIPRGSVFAFRPNSDGFKVIAFHTPSGIMEGSIGTLPHVKAEDKSKPPANLNPPDIDVDTVMETLQDLAITPLAVADPLK